MKISENYDRSDLTKQTVPNINPLSSGVTQ